MQNNVRRFLALGLAVAMLGLAAVVTPVSGKAQAATGPVIATLADGSQVRLAGMTFDPLTGAPRVSVTLDQKGYDAGQAGLYLVQFNGPVYDSYKDAVRQAGAELGDYIPQNAFITQATPDVANRVSDLPFVRAVTPYKPAYKLDTTLVTADGQVITQYNGADSMGLQLLAFSPAAAQVLAQNLKALGADVVGVQGQVVVVQLKLNQLPTVAQNTNLVSVQPVRTYQLFNDKASGIVKSSTLWQNGLDGNGEVVAVADTGLDTGKTDSSMHPDFQGQIKQIYTLGRQGDASDTNGHGTHVAGSIAGNGAASSGQYKGMAYKSKLVFQSVLDSQGGLGGLPNDLNQLFNQAYQAGARIHSNSWGSDANGAYDDASRQVDQFIWTHPDMAIVIAAGNSGMDQNTKQTKYQSIATPGTAKNAITVGASENNRPDLGQYGDNINQIAAFSSRGYTADNRVKPDIVAPGTWVLSTKSSLAPDSNYWKVYNNRYAYDGGTSMATPLTAGSLALVRQWYGQQGVTPTAALLKATLINGAQDLGGGFPNRDQGWGRVDLQNSILPTGSRVMQYENATQKLSTGGSKTYTINVTDTSVPLKVTLVWSDYPASANAGQSLVNDLDLTLTSPSGKVLNGNDFAQPYNDKVDHTNNVEQVVISSPEQGSYTLTVKGDNVPQGPQPYALVYSGAIGDAQQPPTNPPTDPPTDPGDTQAPTAAITAPKTGETVNGTVAVTATAQDNVGVTKVELYVDGAVNGNVSQAPYTFNLDTTALKDGQHQLQVKAYDAAGNAGTSDPVTVNVANGSTQPQPPAPPVPPVQPGLVNQTLTGYGDTSNWYYAWTSFNLDVTAPGTVKASLSWTKKDADLDLYLVGPSGNVVAQAADLDNPEALTFQANTAGKYTLYVNAYGGADFYRVDASYPVDPAKTQVDVQSGTLAQGQAAKEYTVTVGKSGTVNLSLGWTGTGRANLYLVNSQGRTVASSVSAVRNPQALSATVGAGTYKVRVSPVSGTVNYTLTMVYPK